MDQDPEQWITLTRCANVHSLVLSLVLLCAPLQALQELCSPRLNFPVHVSVSDLYIPMIGLPILLQENLWTDPGNI
jgi:hypothetical protein